MNPRVSHVAMAARLTLISAALLMLDVKKATGQIAPNSTTSTAPLHATSGINFDFTSAAVASFVLLMLGLTAVLIILARHMGRAKNS